MSLTYSQRFGKKFMYVHVCVLHVHTREETEDNKARGSKYE